ncbi:MAG: type II toxin-antitoxin system VapC family toxin [Brachymonas sp.]|nr:type II toxin-antitoxin system VapC family toxin [Brachymonas sp.]
MILLDTVVLSEIRKSRPSPKLMAWLKAQREEQLFLSVISLGEIARGIEKAKKTDPEFAQTLAQWLDTLQRLYADRILPVTPPIARLWGEWSAQLGHDGADVLIAATANVHRLQVATRNVRHFERIAVSVIDPFTI